LDYKSLYTVPLSDCKSDGTKRATQIAVKNNSSLALKGGDLYGEEARSYIEAYKYSGKYMTLINYYNSQSQAWGFLNNRPYFNYPYQARWWHSIYKIPRKW